MKTAIAPLLPCNTLQGLAKPHPHAAPARFAVLAQLKRRKIMMPSLLRMAYTVGFETLTAQVSGISEGLKF